MRDFEGGGMSTGGVLNGQEWKGEGEMERRMAECLLFSRMSLES